MPTSAVASPTTHITEGCAQCIMETPWLSLRCSATGSPRYGWRSSPLAPSTVPAPGKSARYRGVAWAMAADALSFPRRLPRGQTGAQERCDGCAAARLAQASRYSAGQPRQSVLGATGGRGGTSTPPARGPRPHAEGWGGAMVGGDRGGAQGMEQSLGRLVKDDCGRHRGGFDGQELGKAHTMGHEMQ